uniref:Uncharacterized protein AlNc14C41G3481 n=1 Tax=Albugo laibachii Nc14 TaxID=890382 RepID=F0W9M6_9STRA|nr:hypothetical protein ARALYDRAFT_478299 [Albugo laibachii Nc14]|eukprot:CCA17844.1 hypothetical protein ARALYDRAFT_478299 [Albugo laibachii Nc14]
MGQSSSAPRSDAIQDRICLQDEYVYRSLRPDPAFLSNLQMLPQNNTFQTQRMTPFESSFFLQKDTLKCDGKNRFNLTFTFDAQKPGHLRVYIAEGDSDSDRELLFQTLFTEGRNQSFDYRKASKDDTTANLFLHHQTCSLHIEMESSGIDAHPIYSNIAIFSAMDQAFCKLLSLRQTIEMDGSVLELKEIFGIEETIVPDGNESDIQDTLTESVTQSRECVICLTDARDTTLLPCHHMCLCNACAHQIQSKSNSCPICRSFVQSFVTISVDSKKQ